jgi:hypothetical protein
MTFSTKSTTAGILHPHGPLSVHLRPECKELGGPLLKLGIRDGTFFLASLPLSDAAEGHDSDGHEQHAGCRAENGNFGTVRQGFPALGDAFGGRDIVIAIEGESTLGATAKTAKVSLYLMPDGERVVSHRVSLLDDLDTLHTTSLITPVILRCSAGITDTDALHTHGEGGFRVVYLSTRPFYGVVGIYGISTGPDAQANARRGLWIVLSSVGVIIFQGSDNLTVDIEVCLVLLPIGGVIVVKVLWRLHFMPDSAIVGSRVALAEVVRLHVGGVSTNPFPVNLVQVVALYDD